MDTPKVWSIYLITNTVNGKMYVGQSGIGAAERWKKHLKQVKFGTKTYFYSAIRKYGPESFGVEELAQVDSRERADNLERVWIILLQTHDRKYGYNSTMGGDGVRSNAVLCENMSKRFRGSGGPLYRHDIKDEDIRRLYVDENKPASAVALELGCSKTTIRGRLKASGISLRPTGRHPGTLSTQEKEMSSKRLEEARRIRIERLRANAASYTS